MTVPRISRGRPIGCGCGWRAPVSNALTASTRTAGVALVQDLRDAHSIHFRRPRILTSAALAPQAVARGPLCRTALPHVGRGGKHLQHLAKTRNFYEWAAARNWGSTEDQEPDLFFSYIKKLS
jgi:hypothetical protein